MYHFAFSFMKILYSSKYPTVVCFFHLTLFLRFIHIVESYDSFIFLCIIFHQVHKPQVIYPLSMDFGLSFAITNNAAMNILVHVSAFVFSKISEKLSKMVLLVCIS